MSMWVPPKVAKEMLDQRQAFTADVLRHLDVKGKLEHWNKILRGIDPYLQLVKARDDTTLVPLKAGYYHVIRHNPGAPPSVIVHEGPNGEYREPDSGLFEELRRGDLWDDRVRQAREKRQKDLKKAEQREREREREERLEELQDRAKAAWSPGVRIPKAIP